MASFIVKTWLRSHASILVRGGSKLDHFEGFAVRDPDVMTLSKKIQIISDPKLDKRRHTALDMRVLTSEELS